MMAARPLACPPRSVLQRWAVSNTADPARRHAMRLELDGPLFEHCGAAGDSSSRLVTPPPNRGPAPTAGVVRSVRHKPTVTHSRHVPGGFARGSMSDERWRAGFALLAPHGLHFDLQVVHWHMAEAAQLARDFPDTTIIINHTALPANRTPAGLDEWRSALQVAAEQPNMVLKISGIGMPGMPWTVTANREIVLDSIRIFGVERCMFASNFPVDRLAGDYATIFNGFMAMVV